MAQLDDPVKPQGNGERLEDIKNEEYNDLLCTFSLPLSVCLSVCLSLKQSWVQMSINAVPG